MARCPNCGRELPDEARFCTQCGAEQPRRPSQEEQPPLPFSPWGPSPLAAQPAGAGGAIPRAEAAVGPPLSARQVWIAVGAILLFLAFIIILGRGGVLGKNDGTPANTSAKQPPMVGIMGEAVEVGATAWGAAFTDQLERVDDKPPQRGQFFAVGIVVGNQGEGAIRLARESVGLLDAKSGERFVPVITAWGTPEQISSGNYATTFTLPPTRAIAGLVVFDVPSDINEPRLLVRDLAVSSRDFTGMIDLTREKKE